MKTVLSHLATTLSETLRPDLASPGKTRSSDPTKGPAARHEARRSTVAEGSPAPLRVTIFDVGKGDCILLQSGGVSVLIDTGYESTAPGVVSQMRARGVRRLDAMIVTHYDRDHVGGIRPIGEAMGVDTIYLPGYDGSDRHYRSCISAVKALGAPTRRVTTELTLHLGDARLTVLSSRVTYVPGAGKVEGNDNDMSLVATLTFGRDSYLFTGDLEEDGIRAYLTTNRGHFDVLKVPHHGESSSNTSDLLDAVRPKVAVITDSTEDAADRKTLKLLGSAGTETLCTSTDGTVTIESSGSGTYSVSTSHGLSGTY